VSQVSSKVDFYQKHLDRVSRSFAFCISELEGDFRENVGLAYLLFRVLDCIEDHPWQNVQKQNQAFAEFNEFILNSAQANQVRDWTKSFPLNIPEHERLLLEEADKVFVDMHSLPAEKQKIFQRHLLNMSRGMQHFVALKNPDNVIKISNQSQMNGYCFFVAGVIGEFLSDVYSLSYEQDFDKNDLVNSVHFGLFLQKINILKDQRDDESEGRFWIADREALNKELSQNALRAFDYIQKINSSSNGYKTFCSWSLFLGLASYPYIQESFAKSKKVKIPRLKAMSIMSTVKKYVKSENSKNLNTLFEKYMKQFELPNTLQTSAPSESFFALYSGRLESAELKNFNIAI
jgi:phytoene/squalene synthetase